ncbi:RNA-binding protein PNO1-like protein [Tribonema minus]|uniref:RNA-binding protein PNO1-like protein n=1 Tax=Tribonema minus TaxID=303371 RepID=A0A835ZET5_9STRA|nr:RNA-binding protein PNO1-like protein [Tribonema minus]
MEVDQQSQGITFHAVDIAAEAEAADDDDAAMGEGGQAGGAMKPNFPPLSAQQLRAGAKSDIRRIRCPPHRLTPLRASWEHIVAPVVEHMKLQIRFNPKARNVELKASQFTEDPSALQRSADFVQAFMLGFEVQDAVALLRLEDLYIDSFEVRDVKMLQGDHLSRAIGRVAGQDGKTRHAIENATRTRVIVADHRIHILGSFANIRVARDAICALILGAPPGKVYNQMRNVARRMNERF